MSLLQNQKSIKLKNAVAIVFDDHLLFADAFSAILERLNLFKSVQTFSDEELFVQYLMNNFQFSYYIFLDYYIHDKNSLMLLNEIKRLNKNSKIIICSSVQTPTIIENALTYQPSGFISKSSGMNIVLECINEIENGNQYLCPVIKEALEKFDNSEKLAFTARELDVLQYFAQGLSISETAEKTFLSKHTIIAHRRNMMAKANCNSITELLAYARKMQII